MFAIKSRKLPGNQTYVTQDATPKGDITMCFWSSRIIYAWVLITESGTVLAEIKSV